MAERTEGHDHVTEPVVEPSLGVTEHLKVTVRTEVAPNEFLMVTLTLSRDATRANIFFGIDTDAFVPGHEGKEVPLVLKEFLQRHALVTGMVEAAAKRLAVMARAVWPDAGPATDLHWLERAAEAALDEARNVVSKHPPGSTE